MAHSTWTMGDSMGSGGPTTPLVVLVVDDDRVSRRILCRVLAQDPRLRVLEAKDGFAALQTLEERVVDIVVTDEVMPGMNGVRLLETIRTRWPGAQRVLYTGVPSEDVVLGAINRGGVQKVLTKGMLPVDVAAELAELVEDRIAGREGRPSDYARRGFTEEEQSEPDRYRALLVCQDRDLRQAYEETLAAAGFHAETVLPVELPARVRDEGCDVVLLDLADPTLDPAGFMRRLRRVDLDTPAVVTAPRHALARAHTALRYGAFRYLLHPVSRDALGEVMTHAATLRRLCRLRREASAALGRGAAWGFGDRASLEVRFEHALEALFVVYQPIVSWSARRVVGYEALVRSAEPALSNPAALFDAARRLQRLGELGAAIRARAPEPFFAKDVECRLFLNLHTSDIECDDLLDSPLSTMADSVVLEITERAPLDALSGMAHRIAALRASGYRIAVDDLGAGYAGLSSFAALEPDIVKLDMSLIRGVHHAPVKRRLIEGLEQACADLGVTLVAEGIEVPEERDALLDSGIDIFQGFLFARPARVFPEVAWRT